MAVSLDPSTVAIYVRMIMQCFIITSQSLAPPLRRDGQSEEILESALARRAALGMAVFSR